MSRCLVAGAKSKPSRAAVQPAKLGGGNCKSRQISGDHPAGTQSEDPTQDTQAGDENGTNMLHPAPSKT
jgi:hypothetical protein